MSYLGSKSANGNYQQIIAIMPKHDVYIEPFLGSGAVMRKKPAAKRSYGLDLNGSMLDINGYEVPNLKLLNQSAFNFIDDFDYASGDVLIYADPPYLLETRTSKARYKYEISTEGHIHLLELLKSKPCKSIISGYPSALYVSMLQGWHTKTYQSMTRGGVRTEQLWWNFEDAGTFTHLYAGSNFTDRQRIKRKAERWRANFLKLPANEQLAILEALKRTK